MKKLLPALIVVVAVAAAILFFVNPKNGSTLDLAPGRAAELAPGDALLYVELPDIERSGVRWKSTALHAISQEPEWKEFLSKWDDFKTQNDVAKSVFGVVTEIEKADPAGLFFAVTSVDGPFPKGVGGFPYRGKKSDVEGVIRQLREQLLLAYPAAKSEISKYEDTEIETLSDKDFTALMAFRDNWFFFGTDMPLMQETLARYTSKPGAKAGLAKDALFQTTLKHGVAEPDALMWARWAALSGKVTALAGMLGGTPSPTVEPQDPNPTEAMLYSAKLDGLMMREELYMHTKDAPKGSAFANRSLAFTQPATYAYLVGDYSGMEEQMKEAMSALELLGGSDGMKEQLASKGLKVEDIFTTFGTELAMMSAWEGGAVFPDFFASVELRDAKKGMLFAELLASSMVADGKAAKSEVEGTSYWTVSDVELGPIQPTLAVNGKHLMFGLNSGVIKAALAQAKNAAANLSTHPGSPYPAALKTVGQPGGGLFYIDAKLLFEKLYDKAKPFIAFQLVGEPEIAKHFDAGKLPQAETISKHLSPMIVSIANGEHGWKIESTGTVSLIGSYGLALPASLFVGMRAGGMAPPPGPAASPAPAGAGTSAPPTATPPAAAPAPAPPVKALRVPLFGVPGLRN